MAKTELEVPDEDTLLEWKRKYSKSDHCVPKVHELRKLVVAFLTFLYPNNVIKKNFNWKMIPCDWPSEVPFLDPNNKADGTTKPRKNDLERMYKYLMDRYKATKIEQTIFSPYVNKESSSSAAGLNSVNDAIQVSCESSLWTDESVFCTEGADLIPTSLSNHISYQSDMSKLLEGSSTVEPLLTEFSSSTREHFFGNKDNYLGIKSRVPQEENLLGKSQIVHRNNFFPNDSIEAPNKLESWDAMRMVNPRTGEPDRYQANEEALGKMEAVELELRNIIDSSKSPCKSPNKIKLTPNDASEIQNPKHSLDNEAVADGEPPEKRMKGKEQKSSRAEVFHSKGDFANVSQEDAKELFHGVSLWVSKPRKEATNFKMKPQLDSKKTKVKMKR